MTLNAFEPQAEGASTSLCHVTEGYTRALVCRRARRLVWRVGLPRSDREDVEQDLWLDLIRRSQRFDAARAGTRTFANRVVDHQATKIFRKCNRPARQRTGDRQGLDDLAPDATKEVASSRRGADGERRDERRLDARELQELALDLETVVARMPPALQELCRRLKRDTVSDLARQLGVTRASLYRKIGSVHWCDSARSCAPASRPMTESP